MAWAQIFLALFFVVTLPACGPQINRETIRFDGLETTPNNFRGIFTLPEVDQQKVPAVILVHGTAGPDSRYEFHHPALLEAGIATFEVDFKSNVFTGPSDRPPVEKFHPWALGASETIRLNPRVDPERIAIMGFSLGGHISVSLLHEKLSPSGLHMRSPDLPHTLDSILPANGSRNTSICAQQDRHSSMG